jgi:hypothetical protein
MEHQDEDVGEGQGLRLLVRVEVGRPQHIDKPSVLRFCRDNFHFELRLPHLKDFSICRAEETQLVD